jgi:beta-phosphoglucomutase-like phosphatase (HAD superfamily)
LYAAKEMGVLPEACVVVEDSPAGVEAARAAGMTALAYAGGLVPVERLHGDSVVVFDDMCLLPHLVSATALGAGEASFL